MLRSYFTIALRNLARQHGYAAINSSAFRASPATPPRPLRHAVATKPRTPKRVVHRIPITKARTNLGQVVRRAHLNRECFILEKDGIPVAGLMSVDDMEDWLELQDPGMRKQIAAGYTEYERGDATSLDEFLTEVKEPASRGKKGSR